MIRRRTLRWLVIELCLFSCVLITGTAQAKPWMGDLLLRDDAVWPSGRAGNYGTVHYFLDEDKHQQITFDVLAQVYPDGHASTELQVEVFTNLNRRDQAKIWENANDAGGPNSYYQVYSMSHIGQSGNNEVYKTTLTAT